MHATRMTSPPVSRDRVISDFPQSFTHNASVQQRGDWDLQVTARRTSRNHTCQRMSKVVVVGDLSVGKTCLINRFCKNVFERDYKATIGVDFEMERFQVCGEPFSMQIWDTAGQEKFKCIASTYYRGAQVIITVFDMADIKSLDHTRQWLAEALRENESDSCLIFLVGTKSDLLRVEELQQTEKDAVRIAADMKAEFWSVSSKTGENVQRFFFRVAALAFEQSVLMELEDGVSSRIGCRDSINTANMEDAVAPGNQPRCC